MFEWEKWTVCSNKCYRTQFNAFTSFGRKLTDRDESVEINSNIWKALMCLWKLNYFKNLMRNACCWNIKKIRLCVDRNEDNKWNTAPCMPHYPAWQRVSYVIGNVSYQDVKSRCIYVKNIVVSITQGKSMVQHKISLIILPV
jgi:hypothetical protein